MDRRLNDPPHEAGAAPSAPEPEKSEPLEIGISLALRHGVSEAIEAARRNMVAAQAALGRQFMPVAQLQRIAAGYAPVAAAPARLPRPGPQPGRPEQEPRPMPVTRVAAAIAQALPVSRRDLAEPRGLPVTASAPPAAPVRIETVVRRAEPAPVEPPAVGQKAPVRVGEPAQIVKRMHTERVAQARLPAPSSYRMSPEPPGWRAVASEPATVAIASPAVAAPIAGQLHAAPQPPAPASMARQSPWGEIAAPIPAAPALRPSLPVAPLPGNPRQRQVPDKQQSWTDAAPAAVATGAAASQPPEGDIMLDGALVGRWILQHLAREAGLPSSGPTGFDPRRTPERPGATLRTQ